MIFFLLILCSESIFSLGIGKEAMLQSGLSLPVIFTDRSKAVLLLWFIFICYHIYNVCLLHDFVATLRLSALPSALYFILSELAL